MPMKRISLSRVKFGELKIYMIFLDRLSSKVEKEKGNQHLVVQGVGEYNII
jgi:hypothetical protein